MYAATYHAVEAARAEQVARLRRWWPRRRRAITPTEPVRTPAPQRVATAAAPAPRHQSNDEVARAA
jgi:hypothetical protein